MPECRCVDCGNRAPTVLCRPCTSLAEKLGYTAPERLAALGHPTLDLDTTEPSERRRADHA